MFQTRKNSMSKRGFIQFYISVANLICLGFLFQAFFKLFFKVSHKVNNSKYRQILL